MIRTVKKFIFCRRGAALVEAAVLMPAMVLTLIIIAQVGVMVNTKLIVVEAAREAAREYASFYTEDEGLCEIGAGRAYIRAYNVITQLPGEGLKQERFDLAVQSSRVTVNVSHPVPVFMPGAGRLFAGDAATGPGTATITGRAVFNMERTDN